MQRRLFAFIVGGLLASTSIAHAQNAPAMPASPAATPAAAPLAFSRPLAPINAYAQTAQMGRGMNILGGDPYWNDDSQAHFKFGDFAKLHQAGFATVRIVTTPFEHMDGNNQLDPGWLARLDRVVNGALAAGIDPIVDLHYNRECNTELKACQTRVIAFWQQVAPRYRNAPNRVIFEILNEPHDPVLTPAVWNTLLAQALAVIRETNPTRNVIIGPAEWNGMNELKNLVLPADDPHIIVTFHYYLPMQFTHQGASWVDFTKNLSGVTWGTPQDRQKVYQDFATAKAWSEANHRPLFLGEFGAYDRGDIESRMRWTYCVARTAEAEGFPWAYWQFEGNFVAFDVDRDDWFQPILMALIPPHSDTGAGAAPAAATMQ
ncbi:MAG TPA: glycoside hydrolase family 5 protein [Rhizomicrobium sp.]|jgi:endoglucanase